MSEVNKAKNQRTIAKRTFNGLIIETLLTCLLFLDGKDPAGSYWYFFQAEGRLDISMYRPMVLLGVDQLDVG